MNGAPGIESARFGGVNSSYPEKFHLIYDTLRRARRPESPARFVCAVALADGHAIVFEGSGTVDGYIAARPAGSGGFGYDPIFFYPPYGCTLAEVSPEQKAAVSHRGVAFRQLRRLLLDGSGSGSGLRPGDGRMRLTGLSGSKFWLCRIPYVCRSCRVVNGALARPARELRVCKAPESAAWSLESTGTGLKNWPRAGPEGHRPGWRRQGVSLPGKFGSKEGRRPVSRAGVTGANQGGSG